MHISKGLSNEKIVGAVVSQLVPTLKEPVTPGTVVHTLEAGSWGTLVRRLACKCWGQWFRPQRVSTQCNQGDLRRTI